MAMPDLEDPQDEWEIKEILNKCWIKSELHYLMKWANWPSKYNFYKPIAHLTEAPKAIAAYEKKITRKHKHKMNTDKDAGPKQSCFY